MKRLLAIAITDARTARGAASVRSSDISDIDEINALFSCLRANRIICVSSALITIAAAVTRLI